MDTVPGRSALRSHIFSFSGFFAFISLVGAIPTHADVSGGSSSGTPLTLNLTSSAGLTAGANLDASTGSHDVDAGVNTIGIGATALTNTASSTVNGGAGSKSTVATAGDPVNAVIDLDDVAITLPDNLGDLPASGLIRISNSAIASDGILSESASTTALTIEFQNINISASVGGLITVQTQVNSIVVAANTSVLQNVPEPSAALLSTGALIALLILRRRRFTL